MAKDEFESGEGLRDFSADARSEAFEQEIGAIIDRLDAAGWDCGGGWTTMLQSVDLTFYRVSETEKMTEEEALQLLPRDEDDFVPGYMVDQDEASGETYLAYNGPYDERFEEFVENLVRVAHPETADQDED